MKGRNHGKNAFHKSVIASIMAALTVVPSVSYADTISTVIPDGPNTGYTAYDILNKSKLGPNPVDGPTDLGHIWEEFVPGVGNVFQIHANQYGDYDGGNLDRQRIELKGHKSSNADVKGNPGDILTYNWQFRVLPGFQMSPTGAFNHIFQLKAQDGDDGAPILTFTVGDNQLLFRHTATGATMDDVEVLASTDWNNVVGNWLDAQITVENTETGKVEMILKDAASGTTLMSYSGIKDNWRADASINRPKWGIYRKIFPGMEDGNVQYTHFEITKHNPSAGTVHQVDLNKNTHIEAEQFYSKTGVFRQGFDSTGTRSGDGFIQVPEGWAYDSPANTVSYKLNVTAPTTTAYLHLYGYAADAASNSLQLSLGSEEGSGIETPVQLNTGSWGWTTVPVSLPAGTQFVTLKTAVDGLKIDKLAITAAAAPPASFIVPKLTDLTINGRTIEGFSPNVKNYTVNLPFGTKVPPVVAGTFVNPATGLSEPIAGKPLSSLTGTSTIQVTNPLEPVLSTAYTIQFNGMELDGTPVPMITYPVASVTGPGNVKYMTDNNITTLWDYKPADTNPNNTVSSAVYFDLQEVQPLNQVYVGFNPTASNTAFKFDVELSSDGTNWTKVLDNQWSNGFSAKLQPFTFPETAARYVRYSGYAGKKNNGTGSLEKYNKVTEIKFAGDTQLTSDNDSLKLNLGEAHQAVVSLIHATDPATPVPVIDGATFRSMDEHVATVSSSGLITGVTTGKTTVEVRYGKHVHYMEVTVGDALDTNAPMWPSGSSSQAVNTYADKAFVTWTAAADLHGGISGYNIYAVNGDQYTLLKQVGNVLYTTLEGLTPSTTYSIALKAVDQEGNESAYGAFIKSPFTTLADTQAPEWGSATLSVSDISTSGARLHWSAAADNVGVTGYRVYSVTDAVYSDALPPVASSYTLSGLTPKESYTYLLQACDYAGNWSAPLQVVFTSKPGDGNGNSNNGKGNGHGNGNGHSKGQ